SEITALAKSSNSASTALRTATRPVMMPSTRIVATNTHSVAIKAPQSSFHSLWNRSRMKPHPPIILVEAAPVWPIRNLPGGPSPCIKARPAPPRDCLTDAERKPGDSEVLPRPVRPSQSQATPTFGLPRLAGVLMFMIESTESVKLDPAVDDWQFSWPVKLNDWF